MDRLLRRRTLAILFGVSVEAFRYWNNKGWLVVDGIINHEAHYRESEVNAFLAREACGMSPPTYERLLKGKVVLVSSFAAREQLGVNEGNLRYLVQTNKLSAIKLGAVWAIERGSLERRVKLRRYTRKNVARVVGVGQSAVRELLTMGELAWADDPDKVIDPVVLVEYVRRHLPEWARPITEEWIEQRLDSQQSLLTVPKACTILGIRYAEIADFLERERIAYIYSHNFRFKRISPEALNDYLSFEPTVSSEEVADWFGVHYRTVRNWATKGLLVCPYPHHIHDDDELYESCWLGIIQPLLSGGGFAAHWLAIRKRYKARMLSVQEAAIKANVSIVDMIKLLEKKGAPVGIRTPGGDWRVSQPQIRHYLTVRRRRT